MNFKTRECKNCGNRFMPKSLAQKFCREGCRKSNWRRTYDIKKANDQRVVHREGLIRIVEIGGDYPHYRVMKRAGLLFHSESEAEAMAYAKGTNDLNFLHNHTLEKLRHASLVTQKEADELITYFISDGLCRLKRNHYKLPYNNED